MWDTLAELVREGRLVHQVQLEHQDRQARRVTLARSGLSVTQAREEQRESSATKVTRVRLVHRARVETWVHKVRRDRSVSWELRVCQDTPDNRD